LRHNVNDADAAPLEGGCSRTTGLKVKCTLPYVSNTKKHLKRGVKPLMPTKLKGMTSLEIAIIVAIVLAIAVAAAWYLYSTFASTIGSNPMVSVRSAYAFSNGTIRVEVVNTGSSPVYITQAFVIDRTYTVRWGTVGVGAGGGTATVFVDTGRWMGQGTIIQGRLITREGYSIPFSARVLY